MRASTSLLIGAAIGAGVVLWLRNRPETPVESKEREDLEQMIEEVAHRKDIPETPVKQAFEEAIGER